MTYIIILLLLFFLIGMAILRRQFITCPENKLLVIYGKVDNPNEHGVEILAGGSKFIYPIIQDYEFMDLSEYKIEYNENLYTKDEVKIHLTANIKFAVSNAPDLMSIAAERLIGKSRNNIQMIAKDIIYGVIRKLISTKDIVDIALNHKNHLFITEISSELDKALNKIGISLRSLKFAGIKDLHNQIIDLENKFNERILHNNTLALENEIDLTPLININKAIEKNTNEKKELLTKKINLLVKLSNKTDL